MLGKGQRSVFRRVALPMARPALIAGLGLIVMEVVNDYGAVHFCGVPTLTEGIFRTWFGLGDRVSGLRIAAIVVFLVFAVLLFERWQGRRLRYAESSQGRRSHRRVRLSSWPSWLAAGCCLLPVLVGFVYPLVRLLHWAWIARDEFEYGRFFEQSVSSILLAVVAALALSALAFFFAFVERIGLSRRLLRWVQASTLGYAIPRW